MADTDFATLTNDKVTAWSKDTWRIARNNSFVMALAGKSENSAIQRIKELKKDEKGARAVITLVPDLEGDGVVGDFTLKSNEEAIKAYDVMIQLDQLRNANISKGRMREQEVVVDFRKTSRNVLGYWQGDRLDQLAMLTLSGVAYTYHTNGKLRAVLGGGNTGLNLSELTFAADVAAPTANRHLRWDAGNGVLAAGDTTAVTATDFPSYAMLVEAKAHAKTHYIKGIKGPGNSEFYHVIMTPQGLAKLKLDADFKAAVNNAGVRGSSNPVFSGSIPTVDGLIIHEFRHCFNTLAATTGTGANVGAPGYKWGANADVRGQRTLILGAQALGMADIGDPYWDEDPEDYNNKQAIAVGKIVGLLKPQFYSPYTATTEDFGVLCVDCAI